MLYNIVVVFAIHQHESAMGAHVSPILNPSTSLPTPSLWVVPQPLSVLLHASNLDQSSISHMVTYMFQGCSLKPSHPDLLPQSPKVCPLHVPLLLPGIQDHCYHLSKFCIYVFIHGILSSLSDLLQSV